MSAPSACVLVTASMYANLFTCLSKLLLDILLTSLSKGRHCGVECRTVDSIRQPCLISLQLNDCHHRGHTFSLRPYLCEMHGAGHAEQAEAHTLCSCQRLLTCPWLEDGQTNWVRVAEGIGSREGTRLARSIYWNENDSRKRACFG